MNETEKRKRALEAKKVVEKYIEEEIPKFLEEKKKKDMEEKIAYKKRLKVFGCIMLIFIIIEIAFIVCAIVDTNIYMLLGAILFPLAMFILYL